MVARQLARESELSPQKIKVLGRELARRPRKSPVAASSEPQGRASFATGRLELLRPCRGTWTSSYCRSSSNPSWKNLALGGAATRPYSPRPTCGPHGPLLLQQLHDIAKLSLVKLVEVGRAPKAQSCCASLRPVLSSKKCAKPEVPFLDQNH